MCFDITFCAGSGRRTPALKFVKNSYGVVAPPVVADGEKRALVFFFLDLLFLDFWVRFSVNLVPANTESTATLHIV